MQQPTTAQLRALLEREIQKTEDAIAAYKESVGPVKPDDAIGRVSRMDAINNKSIVEAALRTAEEKRLKLLYMQDHLEDEDFGKCARCGTAIPPGRLILKPESPFCVRCAR